MALIVQKYGGTSVDGIEKMRHVAKQVASARHNGDDVVVVLSAMGKETDRLINLATTATPDPSQRELDMLISTGEQVSVSLLAMVLNGQGIKARSFTGGQIGIITDGTHTNARIQRISTERLRESLSRGTVPVVAGFQGMGPESEITTLGRGGSDTTAVALAAALGADICDIYTDVDGIYTTDPGIVPEAKKRLRVSYEEMLEMASLGARVLQSRAVAFAMKYRVPVRVRSSFNTSDEGTWVVCEDLAMEREIISGVTYDKHQARITLVGVPDKPGVASKIFNAVAKEDITVDMIIQNIGRDKATDISFTLPRADAGRAKQAIDRLASETAMGDILLTKDIAKVSIVGIGMRSHSGVAAKMFASLAAEGINIIMISTSEIKISCVIDERYTELAVRVLHKAFGLGKTRKRLKTDKKAHHAPR